MDDVFKASDLVDLAAEDHPQTAYFRVSKLAPGDRIGHDEKLRHDAVKPVGDIDGVKRALLPLGLSREPWVFLRRGGFPALGHRERPLLSWNKKDLGKLTAGKADMRVHFRARAVIILLRQLKALFRKVTALYSLAENKSTTYRNIIPTCDYK